MFARSSHGARLLDSQGFSRRLLGQIDPIILNEGEPDTICAISKGFNGITQTAKTKAWKEEHIEPFKGRDVIIAYDADQPGETYAAFAAENLIKVAKSVRILQWPDWMGRQSDGEWPKDHGQDLTDFFVKHKKTPGDLRNLFATAKPYSSAEKPTDAAIPLQFFSHGVNNRLSFKPRLLADKILQDLKLSSEPKTGLVTRWNGRFFELFSEDHIKNLCIRYLGDESQKSRVEDAVYQIKMLSAIPHGREFNDRSDWTPVQNGYLNLRTLELRKHDPDFLFTYELPIVFKPDSNAKCTRWLQFLTETVQTEGEIKQVQEFFGYCLIRDTRYEKALLTLARGGAGQSTCLKQLRNMVGHDNCSAVSFKDLEDQFIRASIYGKSLNLSTEVGAKALESPIFKAVTSGDPITAAFKHKNSFTFTPYCKQAFAVNKLPRVLDNSDGFYRRLLLVSFKRQFLHDADPHLGEKLESELSEIFQWAIVGLHRLWEQDGFTECEESKELLMSYRRLNNPVLCFAENRCIIDSDYNTTKKDIYAAYKKFCSEGGYTALNEGNFFRELYSAVSSLSQYRPRNDKGGRDYSVKGIGLSVVYDQ